MRSRPSDDAVTLRRLVLGVVAAVALLGAGCGIFDDDEGGGEASPSQPEELGTFDGVVELVREVEPSVVSVVVSTSQGSGQGSGVVVAPDGLIVTNRHVVVPPGSPADRADPGITVVLADGSRLDATVEATDPLTDLALLRVDRVDLPTATIADRFPTVGEPVVAIGNALGFENTVTAGIVSGVQRSIPASAALGGQSLVDLIQVDAAISPGNSGGALIDASGEVLGINVAFIPPSAGAVNLGFAIPGPTVADVVEELLADGEVDHPFVGVRLATLTPQIAERFGIGVETGAVVVAVDEGTPAASADLEIGDVITAAGGEDVSDVGAFLTRLRRFDPGDELSITFVRDGDEMTVDLVLAQRPGS